HTPTDCGAYAATIFAAVSVVSLTAPTLLLRMMPGDASAAAEMVVAPDVATGVGFLLIARLAAILPAVIPTALVPATASYVAPPRVTPATVPGKNVAPAPAVYMLAHASPKYRCPVTVWPFRLIVPL